MNKQTNLLLLAATLVTILNFQSCSKYEENPAFSLSTKKSRLVGEWEVIKVDGQSSSQYFGVGYTYTFDFEKDGDFEFGYTYTNGSYTNSYSSSGEWEWENNKEEIEIEINGYVVDFEIIKLTKKELILESANGGEEWEFEKM
ncbi:MAG: lipocalin family protein [Flavobacteriales bacterium]|nr:lipocalin family protein [Flavobacteriales bacterium]